MSKATSKTKKCKVCGKRLPIDCFPSRRGKPGTSENRCKACRKIHRTQRDRRRRDTVMGWAKLLVGRIRCRAKKNNVPFSLTAKMIAAAYPEDGVCPVLGMPFNWRDRYIAAPSVDRLIPEKGYIEGNIAIISVRANHIKYNATLEELESVTTWARCKFEAPGHQYNWAI